MTNPHWRLIINGKSAGDDDLRTAVQAMRDRGVAIDVRVTWEEGDAARSVAGAIASGASTIIAAGGDGTLSEIAAALADSDRPADALPALGLVPMGTANDFAVAGGIPPEPLPALELVAAQPPRPVDLLRLETGDAVHWVANLASGGFGTQVTVETPDGMKKLLGGLAYLLTGLSKLGRIETTYASLRGQGFAWDGDFIALGVGNGRQAGGGQALCPDAVADDGLLDVTVIPELSGEIAATLGAVISDGKLAALERVATRAPALDRDRRRGAAGAQPRWRTGGIRVLPHRMRAGQAAHAPAAGQSVALATSPVVRARCKSAGKAATLTAMGASAFPHFRAAGEGWRWWPAAAVATARPLPEEMPRDPASPVATSRL